MQRNQYTAPVADADSVCLLQRAMDSSHQAKRNQKKKKRKKNKMLVWKRRPTLIQSQPTANVGLAKRLVLDSPPKVPGHHRRRLLAPSRRYHNILVAHWDDLRPGASGARTTSHFVAKIDNRNGSLSSSLLPALSAGADRRISPVVFLNTALAAAAGSRAPLGDTVLLFELF